MDVSLPHILNFTIYLSGQVVSFLGCLTRDPFVILNAAVVRGHPWGIKGWPLNRGSTEVIIRHGTYCVESSYPNHNVFATYSVPT